VDDALGAAASRLEVDATVRAVTFDRLALLTTAVPGAIAMAADPLRSAVANAYVAIGEALTALGRQPIRFWNFIPDPGQAMGHGLDRYMVFNAGRFDGYAQWYGGSRAFGPSLATASGVGIVGDDLVVHCLAADEPGIPVENPRQKPAWQYSARYGPVPPCFSRATIATVERRTLLLIGGTASIVGEDSRHEGDAGAQLEETLKNVAVLVAAARGDLEEASALRRLTDLRVYVTRAEDAPAIRSVLTARCTRAARVELTIARLCRSELLVEIEGVAEI